MPSLLVVDDDRSALHMFLCAFQGTDVDVHTAQSAEEAVEAFQRQRPDAVVLDVVLPGESGLKMVERIHAVDPRVPAIYQHGPRADKRFLAVNCAAIPEPLLESELFGHERGSFTGADTRRIGKFEQAHGGTLFLDEVGDMTPLMQSKVLRALQEQRFERVGGTQTIHTDAVIIAATNRDLEQMVADGHFRPDLYYRLNTYTIVLPPLRQRTTDIPLLVEHHLQRFNLELGITRGSLRNKLRLLGITINQAVSVADQSPEEEA